MKTKIQRWLVCGLVLSGFVSACLGSRPGVVAGNPAGKTVGILPDEGEEGYLLTFRDTKNAALVRISAAELRALAPALIVVDPEGLKGLTVLEEVTGPYSQDGATVVFEASLTAGPLSIRLTVDENGDVTAGTLNVSGREIPASFFMVDLPCTSSDDFGDAAKLPECYAFNNTTNQTDVADNSESAAITAEDGRLKIAFTAVDSEGRFGFDTLPAATKTVTGDFDVHLTVASATIDSVNSKGGFRIVASMTSSGDEEDHFTCAVRGSGCETRADFSESETGETKEPACSFAAGPGTYSVEIDLRVVREGDVFRCFWRRTGETTFNQIGPDATSSGLPDQVVLAIVGESHSTGGTGVFFFDDLVFEMGFASGQE